MQRSLKDFDGREAIFIDANIFLHHAFDINPVSVEFLKKVESSAIKAYTSALVIEEVIFKLTIQSASNFLNRTTLEGVKSLLKNSRDREKIFEPVVKYRGYVEILKDFGMVVLDLTDEDMAIAIQKAREYGLIAADAAHIAAMDRKKIKHIASSDSDFRVVAGVSLWSPS